MENKRMDYIPVWGRYLDKFDRAGLTNEDLGILLRTMMEYQFRGVVPQELDARLEVFWMFIEEDLVRAQLKYDQAVENGKKGGRPPKNREKPEETQNNPEKPRTTTRTRTTSTSTSTTETTSPAISAGSDLSLSEKAYGEFGWVRLQPEQYRELEALMGIGELQRCIAYIDRSAQSTNNRNQWQDWALVLRRCYEGRWHEAAHKPDPIPKGASGVLGQAELEAIQRVLREDTPMPHAPPPDMPFFPYSHEFSGGKPE